MTMLALLAARLVKRKSLQTSIDVYAATTQTPAVFSASELLRRFTNASRPDRSMRHSVEKSSNDYDDVADVLEAHSMGVEPRHGVTQAIKILEKEGCRVTSLREGEVLIQMEAPIQQMYEMLEERGFISQKKKRPQPNDSVITQDDDQIVAWYRSISIGMLNYYLCCDNLSRVKSIINYHLRWSAILTLSKKHKSSCHQIIQKFGKDLTIMKDGTRLAAFLSPGEISKYNRTFLRTEPMRPDLLIDILYTRLRREGKLRREQKGDYYQH